jgi:hypothetical protein
MSNPLALDPCPSCEEIDQCFVSACICPVCNDDPRAFPSWERFAPIMRGLNSVGIVWNWGTDSIHLDGPERHYLEINGTDIWYEIHLKEDHSFIVEKIFITKAFNPAGEVDSKVVYSGASAALTVCSIDFKEESC